MNRRGSCEHLLCMLEKQRCSQNPKCSGRIFLLALWLNKVTINHAEGCWCSKLISPKTYVTDIYLTVQQHMKEIYYLETTSV